MDLDEAVALLRDSTLISPKSRLHEARQVVLDVVERAQAAASYTDGDVQESADWILSGGLP